MKVLFTAWLLVVPVLTVHAGHHSHEEISVASPKCRWIDGESVRDIGNLSEFCARFVPVGLQVRAASASRERLWIEITPQLAATLLAGDVAARPLLEDWLERWKTITRYRSASVVLLVGHHEVAKVEATLTADAVILP